MVAEQPGRPSGVTVLGGLGHRLVPGRLVLPAGGPHPAWLVPPGGRPDQGGLVAQVVEHGYWRPYRTWVTPPPRTRLEYQTVLAWTLHLNVSAIGFKYGQAIDSGRPIVLFTPLSHGGWKV